jgi:hypothetical protein
VAISLFLDERGVVFDAVVGVNDAIAIGAMQALHMCPAPLDHGLAARL